MRCAAPTAFFLLVLHYIILTHRQEGADEKTSEARRAVAFDLGA